VASKSGSTFATINPTNGKEICHVSEASADDVDVAVSAARAAFDGEWRHKMTPEERGKLMYKLATLFEENAQTLAAIEALDNGKTLAMASGDVAFCASALRYYAGWADKIEGKVIDTDPGRFNYTKAEPVSQVRNSLFVADADDDDRSVYALRLSHGISHYLCGRGRLDLPLLLATQLF
jgi:acyl-CoA reductase-like NAD-dependent aldehyde dehydrogenase